MYLDWYRTAPALATTRGLVRHATFVPQTIPLQLTAVLATLPCMVAFIQIAASSAPTSTTAVHALPMSVDYLRTAIAHACTSGKVLRARRVPWVTTSRRVLHAQLDMVVIRTVSRYAM
jgi:hypothetical protein